MSAPQEFRDGCAYIIAERIIAICGGALKEEHA